MDVSGLVVGAVTLVSLFSTCIELFDLFELGKNLAYDYQLACTKIILLRTRLEHWGEELNIETPGAEYTALREHWPVEKEIVGRCLSGIQYIFSNTSLLTEKYELIPTRIWRLQSSIPQSRATKGPPTNSKRKFPSIVNWSLLRKRTLWAVHDKQKFEHLIQDLSFLIENLEKVTSRLSMGSSGTSQGSDDSNGQPAEAKQRMAVISVKEAQDNKGNSIGIQGGVGYIENNYEISGRQTNSDFSFGIQGGASAEAIAILQDRAHARGGKKGT